MPISLNFFDGYINRFMASYNKSKKPIEISFRNIISNIKPDRATHLIHSYPAKLLVQIPFFFLNNNIFSKEGDTVLDPFCGCGTTIASAQRLNRRWIGIDITSLAITLIKKRLADAHGEAVRATYQTLGEPTSLQDAEALAAEDKYQFQWWALGLVNARPITEKKGADQGIDGRIYFHDEDAGGPTKQIILSVKGGHVDVKDVRELHSVVKREKAAIGVLITLEDPTKPMRKEAANGEFYASQWGAFPQLQILTVKDLLEGKTIKRPPTSKADVTFKQAPKAKYRVEKSAGLKFSDPEPRDDEEQPF